MIYGGATTPDPGFGVVGPAVFPVAIGALMLAAAAWLARDALASTIPPMDPVDWRPFGGTVASTFLYLVLFVPLGFILTSAAFLVIQARLLGSRSLARDVIATVLFVAMVYVVFVKFLTIDLPRGPLPSL